MKFLPSLFRFFLLLKKKIRLIRTCQDVRIGLRNEKTKKKILFQKKKETYLHRFSEIRRVSHAQEAKSGFFFFFSEKVFFFWFFSFRRPIRNLGMFGLANFFFSHKKKRKRDGRNFMWV